MYHSFNTAIAKECGMAAAVLFENIRYWIRKNAANNKHFYDGRYWTYNSNKAFAEQFDYLSPDQIYRAIAKLEAKGLLLGGNYNASPYDRTKWYALSDAAIAYISNIENAEADFANLQNGNSESPKPIPNINTNINTNNTPLLSSTNLGTRSMSKDTSYNKILTVSKLQVEDNIPQAGESEEVEQQPSTKKPAMGGAIPFEQIVESYNTICRSLPKCLKLTAARRKAIRARFSEGFTLSDFEKAFKAAQESDFLKGLSGDNERKWRADFDFCIGTKMARIIEGAYSGKVDESEIGFGYQGRKWSGDVTNGDF